MQKYQVVGRIFNMIHKIRRHTEGQTLIETLISVLFIAVTAIALIRFQGYLSYDNSLIQQKSEAAINAASKIGSLRDFQVLNNTTGYTSYQSIASGTSSVTGNYASYTVTWTVTSYTNPTYKNISVMVTWTDRYGVSQSIQQVSNIAGIDPQYSAAIM